MSNNCKLKMSNNCKLNKHDVEVIRRLSSRGYNSPQIASVFDVKPSTVRSILTGKIWKEGTR